MFKCCGCAHVELERESEGEYPTVFMASFLIQEYVGLHVPDELVSQKLRLLSGPQDVLSHITHLHQVVTGQKYRESSDNYII